MLIFGELKSIQKSTQLTLESLKFKTKNNLS